MRGGGHSFIDRQIMARPSRSVVAEAAVVVFLMMAAAGVGGYQVRGVAMRPFIIRMRLKH